MQLAERTMCSRYSFMNRHLPKLLIIVIAMIILSAGAARQGRRDAAERARPAARAGRLEGGTAIELNRLISRLFV